MTGLCVSDWVVWPATSAWPAPILGRQSRASSQHQATHSLIRAWWRWPSQEWTMRDEWSVVNGGRSRECAPVESADARRFTRAQSAATAAAIARNMKHDILENNCPSVCIHYSSVWSICLCLCLCCRVSCVVLDSTFQPSSKPPLPI